MPSRRTGYPGNDEGDSRSTDRDGHAVRRGRRRRSGRAHAASPSHLLEHGSHGLVVGGTTGECPTLTDEETIELLRAVRAEVGDDGAADLRHRHQRHPPLARADADGGRAAGADASLVVAPYYNKPNAAGLRAHFESVAAAVPELPMVMYNIPSRVVINMPPELLAELGRESTTSSPSSRPTTTSSARSRASRSSPATTTPSCRVLEFGGAGGITVASHVAGRQMREMWDAAQAGDLARAREIDAELTPLYEGLSVTTNPIPIKAALEMLGLASERMRLPLVPADADQRAAVRAALEGIGLPVAQ